MFYKCFYIIHLHLTVPFILDFRVIRFYLKSVCFWCWILRLKVHVAWSCIFSFKNSFKWFCIWQCCSRTVSPSRAVIAKKSLLGIFMKGDNEQKYISINWFLNWLFSCRLISYLIMFCLQVNSVKKCKNAKWKNDSGISIPTTCLFKGPT